MIWLCVVGMAKLLVDLDVTQKFINDFQVTRAKIEPFKNKGRALNKKKMQKTIVESLHSSIMAMSYHIHFATYFSGNKNVTQLIPSTTWKSIYINYIVVVYIDFPFIEDTLNDCLWVVLKEMKIDNFNEERSYKVVLQLDEVLA